MSETIDYPATGFVLPEQAEFSASELVTLAETAVSNGFDSVWCSEEWGYSAFSILSRIAETVSCPLGTCVVSGFARTPATIAANALSLDEATDGSFFLGVGTSTPEMVEGFHGVPFTQPLRRLRETFEIVDQALSGERVNYDGMLFSPEGFRLNHAPARSVPILNAAVGPTNIALSIEFANGILPHLLPFSAIDTAIERAANQAGQQADLAVLPTVPTCVSNDGTAARETLDAFVAYCIGSTHVFANVLSRYGYAAEVETIRDHWHNGDHEAAADAVSHALLNDVAIAGTPAQAQCRLDNLVEKFDSVLVTCPHGVSVDRVRTTVDAFAP